MRNFRCGRLRRCSLIARHSLVDISTRRYRDRRGDFFCSFAGDSLFSTVNDTSVYHREFCSPLVSDGSELEDGSPRGWSSVAKRGSRKQLVTETVVLLAPIIHRIGPMHRLGRDACLSLSATHCENIGSDRNSGNWLRSNRSCSRGGKFLENREMEMAITGTIRHPAGRVRVSSLSLSIAVPLASARNCHERRL